MELKFLKEWKKILKGDYVFHLKFLNFRLQLNLTHGEDTRSNKALKFIQYY